MTTDQIHFSGKETEVDFGVLGKQEKQKHENPITKDIQILEGHPEKVNPMFDLEGENGREEKMNQGEGKNVDSCDRFLNKFSSFLFLSFYSNSISFIQDRGAFSV